MTIAVLSDETGGTALTLGEVFKATAESINANGGLNGHPIKLDIQDMKSDTTAAQGAVARIPKDAVAVILNSNLSEASIAPALGKLDLPVLGNGYAPSAWSADISVLGLTCAKSKDYCAQPNFMTTTASIEASIAAQLLGAKNVGAKKVVSAVCAEVDSCSAGNSDLQGHR